MRSEIDDTSRLGGKGLRLKKDIGMFTLHRDQKKTDHVSSCVALDNFLTVIMIVEMPSTIRQLSTAWVRGIVCVSECSTVFQSVSPTL